MRIDMAKNKTLTIKDQTTEFLLYTTPNGEVKVEVFLHNENLWLTQDRIADLFGIDRTVITKHLKNIYEELELNENLTSAKIAQVQKEGNREVKREVKFYNLDAIIAVGYRVNSKKATQFRMWATTILKEYIIKGYAMDDERMKNGQYFGKDYFQELLERIRSIRTSERRIYQKITDIFAECSSDYDKNADITKNFYAMVQNKFHFAITGKTAAEIVYEKADKDQPFMGLKTWKNATKGRVLKSDTIIAKNYLEEKEIKQLERTISSYFDYIERMIEAREILTMEKLAQSINEFLQFNKYDILQDKGKVSHQQAEEKAFAEYDEFNKTQSIESDFDREMKKLLKKDDTHF